MVYTMDKKLAMFLDRPPLVMRQYCDMEAPADVNISDDDTTRMRSKGVSLDALGFSTGGKSSPITFIRLRFLLAIIKEEILEMQLGTNKSTVREKAPYVAHCGSKKTVKRELTHAPDRFCLGSMHCGSLFPAI